MTKPSGKHQRAMYSFLKRNSGWQSYSKDSVTKKTVNGLKKRKLICTNRYSQMKIKKEETQKCQIVN